MSGAYLKQKVNSYLCIALLAVMTFWVVLYYFSHKAFAVADNASDADAAQTGDWGGDLATVPIPVHVPAAAKTKSGQLKTSQE